MITGTTGTPVRLRRDASPSTIATSVLVRDLFPGRPTLGIRHITLAYGSMNLVVPFFSGVPVRHGCGGLAGHYRFGARTGAGEPRPLGGHARDRYVYAPADGRFHTDLGIRQAVAAGEVVGRIGAVALMAPIDGVLRGFTRDAAPVTAGTKVIEVDPRGWQPK